MLFPSSQKGSVHANLEESLAILRRYRPRKVPDEGCQTMAAPRLFVRPFSLACVISAAWPMGLPAGLGAQAKVCSAWLEPQTSLINYWRQLHGHWIQAYSIAQKIWAQPKREIWLHVASENRILTCWVNLVDILRANPPIFQGEHHDMNRELRRLWHSEGLDVQLARVACRNSEPHPSPCGLESDSFHPRDGWAVTSLGVTDRLVSQPDEARFPLIYVNNIFVTFCKPYTAMIILQMDLHNNMTWALVCVVPQDWTMLKQGLVINLYSLTQTIQGSI